MSFLTTKIESRKKNMACNKPLSKIIFGCEPLGGTDWGQYDMQNVKDAARYAAEKNLSFDTADVYGLGQSEINLALALKELKTATCIIGKFGHRFETPEKQETPKKGERAKITLDASPYWLRQALMKTLARLELRQLPVYLLHRLADNADPRPTIEELEKVKNEGLIGEYGVSNLSQEQLRLCLDAGSPRYFQGELSLLKPELLKTTLPICKKNGIHFMAYGCLAQGLLTGKFLKHQNFTAKDRRHRLSHFSESAMAEQEKALKELVETAKRHKTSATAISLAWVLKAGADSCVVGMKSTDHVDQALDSLRVKLSEADTQLLSQIFHPISIN